MLRDQGRTADAVQELRSARELARRSRDADRLADVRATLGSALALDGQTRTGLRELDRAVAGAVDRRIRARCLMRRGYVLTMVLARHRDALTDLKGALTSARALGDRLWEARTLSTMSFVHLDVGNVATAERVLAEARRIFEAEGQDLEALQAMHSQGTMALFRGDLPAALRLYDEAGAAYERWGDPPVELGEDQCQALLTAGLPDEACRLAVELLAHDRIHRVNRAELELYLSFGQLARGDAQAALVAGQAARDSFRRQRRVVATARAELVVLAARRRAGARGAALAAAAERLARELEAFRSEDAPVAWLLAGRAAADVGSHTEAELWAEAAKYRRHPSGLVRATAWLAEGLGREQRDDVRGMWHACRRGLDALDHHRSTLGSTELRALASTRGDELARLALARAAHARPRALLWWSERWRATALTQPALRPPDDDELAGLLGALRANDRRLAEARDGNEPVILLERERSRLEKAIQHRRRLVGASAEAAAARAGLDVGRLVDEVGDGSFVELVEIAGQLRSVVVAGGRVRAYVVGSAADAAAAVDAARFVLRQAARGRPVALAEIGLRLQQALLGPSVAALRPGPVVVSPTAALHATPWGLLPVLTGAEVSVVPTASTWLRARAQQGAPGRVLPHRPGARLRRCRGAASGGRASRRRGPGRRVGDRRAVPARHGRCGAGACGGPRQVPGRQPDVLRARDGRRTPDGARPRAARPGAAPDRAVGLRLGGHGARRRQRAARPGLGPDVDGDRGHPGQRRAGQRRGHGRADGAGAPRAGRLDDLGAVMQRVRERARGDVVTEATAAAFVALGV